MAHIWYEGNLNKEEAKREHAGIIYYDRGPILVQDKAYERYGLKTHFITQGEDYLTLMKDYVLPLYQDKDVLSISEKVIAMCQGETVEKEQIKVGFFAKWLSKFATRTRSGIGMDEPYKLQLVIDLKGLPMVLFASVIGGIGKLFKKRGLFYKILGKEVAGIDGLYAHSAFEIYHHLAVLLPSKPDEVCQKIYETYQISAMIVDANDIAAEIIGCSQDLKGREEELSSLIADNPAGQDDELTPFILIRPVQEVENSKEELAHFA